MEKKIKILLVEDDMNLGFVIQDTLSSMNYQVHLSKDGKDGLLSFNKDQYDLCLLDVMLPKKDGFSLAEDIRKIDKNIPIIFLTAKDLAEDKVKGFKAGADDYITKPFNMDEFQLRIEALLKRSGKKEETNNNLIKIGKYTFDISDYRLRKEGDEDRKLTKKEAEILKLLSKKQGNIIERELILNLVWGDDNYFNGRSLDVFITKLRKYLKADENININNVHGIGFVLNVET